MHCSYPKKGKKSSRHASESMDPNASAIQVFKPESRLETLPAFGDAIAGGFERRYSNNYGKAGAVRSR